MHLNFTDVHLLYYGYQHVSAIHVARKKKIVIKMCLNHSTVLKLEIRFKKHICYITSNNPQLADTRPYPT